MLRYQVLMGQRGLHEEAIEDYDELMRLDPDARCAAVGLRSERGLA